MKHAGTKTVETNRLILRQFRMDDASDMYNNWAGDPAVTKYLMWPTHGSMEVTQQVLTDWVSRYSEADYYQWAITLKVQGDAPIGSIAVVHKDDRAEMVHIGYCIGKPFWNQGIVTEAMDAVIRFLFDVVGVNRVEARHDPRNPSSGQVMLKCGMTYEGTMRESDWNNQGICDAAMYGILRKDRGC